MEGKDKGRKEWKWKAKEGQEIKRGGKDEKETTIKEGRERTGREGTEREKTRGKQREGNETKGRG